MDEGRMSPKVNYRDFCFRSMLSHFSHVQLFVTLWTVARQAPLSMGILQARILEWVGISFSRGSSQPRDWTVSFVSPALSGGFFTTSATWVAHFIDLFFSFIFISCRLITLQYCSSFSHTLTWISYGFTCVPHPDSPSRLPPHPIPLGLPSAPGPSTCLMHPTWAGDLFHPW